MASNYTMIGLIISLILVCFLMLTIISVIVINTDKELIDEMYNNKKISEAFKYNQRKSWPPISNPITSRTWPLITTTRIELTTSEPTTTTKLLTTKSKTTKSTKTTKKSAKATNSKNKARTKTTSATNESKRRKTTNKTKSKDGASCGVTSVKSNLLNRLITYNIKSTIGTGRIIAGTEAVAHSYPWQVSLREMKDHTLYDHFCGGVLVHNRFVLTAAHCVSKLMPSQLLAVTGLHLRTDVSSYAMNNSYKVSNIFVHENYKQTTLENDIAILKLEKPVKLSSNVTAICLPERLNKTEKKYLNKTGIVTGWGLKSYSETSKQLQQTLLTILDNGDTRCSKFLNEFNKETMFCAMDRWSTRLNSNVCSGDSGGPLVIYEENKWILLGIVSYVQAFLVKEDNKYHCDSSLPSFYTKVPILVDWIENKFNQTLAAD
jgi:chymotrypsin